MKFDLNFEKLVLGSYESLLSDSLEVTLEGPKNLRRSFRFYRALSKDTLRSIISLEIEKLLNFNI